MGSAFPSVGSGLLGISSRGVGRFALLLLRCCFCCLIQILCDQSGKGACPFSDFVVQWRRSYTNFVSWSYWVWIHITYYYCRERQSIAIMAWLWVVGTGFCFIFLFCFVSFLSHGNGQPVLLVCSERIFFWYLAKHLEWLRGYDMKLGMLIWGVLYYWDSWSLCVPGVAMCFDEGLAGADMGFPYMALVCWYRGLNACKMRIYDCST